MSLTYQVNRNLVDYSNVSCSLILSNSNSTFDIIAEGRIRAKDGQRLSEPLELHVDRIQSELSAARSLSNDDLVAQLQDELDDLGIDEWLVRLELINVPRISTDQNISWKSESPLYEYQPNGRHVEGYFYDGQEHLELSEVSLTVETYQRSKLKVRLQATTIDLLLGGVIGNVSVDEIVKAEAID